MKRRRPLLRTVTGRFALRATSLGLFLLWATPAAACSVCYSGDADAPIVRGLEYSILFMIGLTYFLIFAGVAFFFVVRRRARKHPNPTTAQPQGA